MKCSNHWKKALLIFPTLGCLAWATDSYAATNTPPRAGFATSLAFDGTDDYVLVNDADALDLTDSYSIECWFKADSFGGLRGLVTKYQTPGANGWLLRLNWADLDFDQMHTGSPELQTGRWYHVAAVNDQGTRHLYLDGAERSLSGTPLDVVANDDPVCLGSDYLADGSRLLAGQIEEVRIWNTALSGTVVSNWMFREVDPTHPAFLNLAAYYKLNDGTGTNAADSAGANTGSLQNMSGTEWTDSTAGREYAMTAGDAIDGQLPGSDPDGASSNGVDWALTFEIASQPSHGTATVVSANNFTYAAPMNASPQESFTYRVRDSSNAVSDVSTVMVAVAIEDPFVDVTNVNESVPLSVTTYTVGGSNNAWVVGTMWWTNSATATGGQFQVSGFTFQVSDTDLAYGTNTITVFGSNSVGAVAQDSVVITRPTIRYVWTNSPSPGVPYSSWATAAHTIQAAVDAAIAGDEVWVTNGVYSAGGAPNGSPAMSNRVYITKNIRVVSMNGPTSTFIKGAADPVTGGLGTNATRCVYMTVGSLSGFTLSNGYTRADSGWNDQQGGGGALAFGGVISNCMVTACVAGHFAGGLDLFGGVAWNCEIFGNTAYDGGGVEIEGGQAYNCLIRNNRATHNGGGVSFWQKGALFNCTITANTATNQAGGVYCYQGGPNLNCIIYANSASGMVNNVHTNAGGTFSYSCTWPSVNGTGNITNDPRFVGGGDYRLQTNSPCVDAGTYQGWMAGAKDLAGNPRFLGNNVDMGAYERLPSSSNAAFVLVGMNGSGIASGSTPSQPGGTDFGGQRLGASAVTNVLMIRNGGLADLNITSWTNTGTGVGVFSFPAGVPATVSAGSASNLSIRFNPTALGSFTSVLSMVNNSAVTPFIVNLAGGVFYWSPTEGPAAGGNLVTVSNGSLGTVTNVLVGGTNAAIQSVDATWVTFMVPGGLAQGLQDIVLQTADRGDTTLVDAYTVNPAGRISDDISFEDWGSWKEVAGLPAGRGCLAAGVLNGALYAVGGYDDSGNVKTNVYRFNGTNWTEVAGLPAPRQSPAAGTLNGSLYVIGGELSENGQRSVYRYNGTSWSEVAGLSQGRSALGAGVLNGALYAVGGFGVGTVATTERYDGTNWTTQADLPTARENLTAGILNNALYAIGGADYSGYGKTNVYRYNGTNWTEVAGLPAARKALAAGTLNGYLYAIGGQGSSQSTNVYRYPGVGTYPAVDPSSGRLPGGYQVTIRGSNLCNGADVTNVTLCGVSAASVVFQSATQIVIVAGSSPSARTGDVAVCSVNYGVTVRTNVFIYGGPAIVVMGTNGVVVTSGGAADAAKGTDFGHWPVGSAVTNTLSITNGGNTLLTISGWATNGPDASAFRISGLPASRAAGAGQTFKAAYAPMQVGVHNASLLIANDATNFTVNLRGAACQLSTNVGPYAGGNTVTITNSLLGSGSDITNVLVGGVAATIVTQGASWVTITLPAIGSAALKDIIVQSASVGVSILQGVYYVNAPGCIVQDPVLTWSETAGLPIGVGRGAVAALNGALYAMGGYGSTCLTNVYRFDGTNWAAVAGLPAPRDSLAAGVLNGALYAVGGEDAGVSKANMYRYDGTNWTEVAGLPAARMSLAVKSWNGALYAMGGQGAGSAPQTNMYRYNGTNWTEVAGLPVGRFGLGAAVQNGALYAVGGGNDTGQGTTNVFRYDGAKWTEVFGLPGATYGFGICEFDDALYVIAGKDTFNVYRFAGMYWTRVQSVPVARSWLGAAVLENAIYAVGGVDDGNNPRPNVYRSYPGTPPPSGVNPSGGSCTGGYAVAIAGINLCNGTDATNVTLCGVPAAGIISRSATQVVVTASAGTPARGDVVVYSTSFGPTLKTNVFSYNPSITVNPMTNGTVSPGGAVEVPYGESTSFVVAADTYYHIGALYTNGVADAAAASQVAYTSAWANVTNMGTLTAAFAENLAPLGTPEWWLALWGWTSDFAYWETNDTDGDLFSAWEERIADTIPTDSNSFLAVVQIHNTNSVAVVFGSSTARTYALEFNAQLVTGGWSLIAGPVTGEVGGTTMLIDTNGFSSGAYRVDVQSP